MGGDLWDGADVRWSGPETVRGGVHLRPGDRAVVVDARSHRMRSFDVLARPVRVLPPRAGGGVTIRLPAGDVVTVARRDLELVAPDHPLSPEADGTLASWWLEQLEPWGRGVPVGSLVPSSLEAVCQVLHPWWGPDDEPVRWRTMSQHPGLAELRERYQTHDGLVQAIAHQEDLGQARTGQLDDVTASPLVDVLGRATTTPEDVFVAVWEGWGDVPPERFPGAARLPTLNRGHFLLRGPLTGVLDSVSASGSDGPVSGLWWPADRAWFVATDIDFEWTFVAGASSLIDRLIADDRLEVVPTTFDAPANRAAPGAA
jgi:hypothetical protein